MPPRDEREAPHQLNLDPPKEEKEDRDFIWRGGRRGDNKRSVRTIIINVDTIFSFLSLVRACFPFLRSFSFGSFSLSLSFSFLLSSFSPSIFPSFFPSFSPSFSPSFFPSFSFPSLFFLPSFFCPSFCHSFSSSNSPSFSRAPCSPCHLVFIIFFFFCRFPCLSFNTLCLPQLSLSLSHLTLTLTLPCTLPALPASL